MRWLSELLRPERKCARVGHVEGWIEVYRGFTIPSLSPRAVADSVLRTRASCGRCGAPLGTWKVKHREAVHGLTLDSGLMTTLELQKEVWIMKRREKVG